MALLVLLVAMLNSLFFYCQAIANGMGRRRWALAGLMFGPFIWPMFSMKKRMKIYKMVGLGELILKA